MGVWAGEALPSPLAHAEIEIGIEVAVGQSETRIQTGAGSETAEGRACLAGPLN